MEFRVPAIDVLSKVADCGQAEEVVLWAFRRWVLGLRKNDAHLWSEVWSDFAVRFGSADGKIAVSGLACCVKTMQYYARRTISHYPPCCRYIAADELGFVQFVGSCQGKNRSLSRLKAEWFVLPDGIGDFLQGGMRIASTLSIHGLEMPDRYGQKRIV